MKNEKRRQIVGGKVTPTGNLESLARRQDADVSDNDSVGLVDNSELQAAAQGEIFSIRKDTPDGRIISADVTPDGITTSRTEGPRRTKRDREIEACQRLVHYLKECGQDFGVLKHTGDAKPETGYDCEAKGPAGVLYMQHTQAEHDPQLIATLARTGTVDREGTVAALADSLSHAIKGKQRMADSRVTLVLDASDLSAHALPAVVDNFRARYGSMALECGYKSVWVVGPSNALCDRLDEDSTT